VTQIPPNSLVPMVVLIAVVVCIAVYMFLALSVPYPALADKSFWRKIKSGGPLARPVVFMFLTNCFFVDTTDAMFYWMTSDLCPSTSPRGSSINSTNVTTGNHSSIPVLSDDGGSPTTCVQGPMFDPVFIGFIDCAQHAGYLLGIILYNKFLRKWTYRQVFLFAQLLIVALLCFDLVLVMRWNQAVHVPDTLFVFGEKSVAKTAKRFFYMPMFVMAAKLCPEDMEATLFATMMALSNFGGDVGRYIGIGVLGVFGVSRTNYDNLSWVIVSKMVLGLVPIIFIFLLVPDAHADDDLLKGARSKDKGVDDQEQLLDVAAQMADSADLPPLAEVQDHVPQRAPNTAANAISRDEALGLQDDTREVML